MASKLTTADRELLISKTMPETIIGINAAYENGKYGSNERDFLLFELYNEGSTLLESKILASPVLDNNKLEIYPATYVKNCGYDTGTYKVKFHFLRALAGNDSTVLLRTNVNNLGEIWPNLSEIYITDDGKVYKGTEEQYNAGGVPERLMVEDYKYQINEISPSRTEVKLMAKDIKDLVGSPWTGYKSDFKSLQSSFKTVLLDGTVNFQPQEDINQTTTIQITHNSNFVFTDKMLGADVTIPDIFKVDEIETEIKSEGNWIQNGNFEELKLGASSYTVTSIVLTAGGQYSGVPTVNIEGGATAVAIMGVPVEGGQGEEGDPVSTILAISLTSGGTGYTTSPNVTFSGGGSVIAATATALISPEIGTDEIITIDSPEIAYEGGLFNSLLHPNAVQPVGWSQGFSNWDEFHGDDEQLDSNYLEGFNAHYASDEGVTGGVCMKFPDMNLDTMESIEPGRWPDSNPFEWGLSPEKRYLRLMSDYQDPINIAGVKHGDKINVSFDIKSTSVGKGVNVWLQRYVPADATHPDGIHKHWHLPIQGSDNPLSGGWVTSVATTVSNMWQRKEISFLVDDLWLVSKSWRIIVLGHMTGEQQGITWVDNVEVNFTYTDQTTVEDVLRPYSAKITHIPNNNTIVVDKSFEDVRNAVYGVSDTSQLSNVPFALYNNPAPFDNIRIDYTINNPYDLRTYLKFDNDLFLTTNFKADRTISKYPYSIVYKLYEPLPAKYEKFDECSIVKEMLDPVEEIIQIVDFEDIEYPDTVLKPPDFFNAESSISRRSTGPYKSEIDVLTDDDSISEKLRDEFISQSFESVELNTDYSQYKNFINFSSAEQRIRNFKQKLENIESYTNSSASLNDISGSDVSVKKWTDLITETKNNLDPFEKYMYNESSSYITSSLGEFFDNAWPKASGAGTIRSPYVLTHTTSSQATTWFNNAIISSSNYDTDNFNKLSFMLPSFIKDDTANKDFLKFTDMMGHHFDFIWEYVNAISSTYDRREKLDEGISKDLLYTIAKSLGWEMNDAKDLVDLPRYALGVEVTGSAFSDYSAVSDRDISREIWSRIINNMPFFLKNKGTVKALKGLINVYGIPSTILRVKEYGGPNLPDDSTPQFETTRKFTKALDFRSGQYIKTTWTDDSSTSRKSDTVEFRFRAATGSNQMLVRKKDGNNQDWFLRLKDNSSTDNYGYVSFMLSGSQVGADVGQYKEITSSALPVYDGDFYSVMVRRTSGSDNINVSQSYELHVGKYDSSRSKIHLYSTSTMDVTQSPSASFSHAWTGSGDIYIGGSGSAAEVASLGVLLSGSIMEYRHWTETLNTSSFKNHIRNPHAYNGNSISSSYENLVLRYSFNDNEDLSTDTDGILDSRANQQLAYSGSHSGYTGNFYSNVIDELQTYIPSIGALRRTNNKIRIENHTFKQGTIMGDEKYILNYNQRSTKGVYDTAPLDSNKVGIFFAPTDVINNDIINSVADLKFDDYLGDPRDLYKLDYRGLKYVANNYWKKYNSPNNFWDYMRLIKYYDQSMFPQLKKMIPARAKANVGVLVEPNIFERSKLVKSRKPNVENTSYTSSAVIPGRDNQFLSPLITSSFNAGSRITDYSAYNDTIRISTYDTGSALTITSSYLLYEGSSSEAADMFIDRSIWQVLNTGDKFYATASITFGDINPTETVQPFISGSRVHGTNQKINKFYSSAYSHSMDIYHSSSYYNVDLDNRMGDATSMFNMFYAGVKNTRQTTIDGGLPWEYIITSPTKLVPQIGGDSSLKTGEGEVSEFRSSQKEVFDFTVFEQQQTGLINIDDPPATTDPIDPIVEDHDDGPISADDIDDEIEDPPQMMG